MVAIEKIYQTLTAVFDHISKHVEVRQKYTAARRIFNSPLGVRKCGQARSFVFDILHPSIQEPEIAPNDIAILWLIFLQVWYLESY